MAREADRDLRRLLSGGDRRSVAQSERARVLVARSRALDSVAIFAQQDATLLPVVGECLRDFEQSGSKALATRARHIRDRLEGGDAR